MSDPKSPPGGTMTKDVFVQWAEQHMRVMCTGLLACNPIVPPEIMGEVIAEAMGRCLGSMTIATDANHAIEIRRKLSQIFKRAIRDTYPAMQPQQHVHAPAQGALN